jgi:TolA-binding protein
VKPACPRLFEAEALRDGRLSGAELARFQAHVEDCAACSRETRALQALAEALRFPTSSADSDELHVRRERTRLLAAFDASLVPDPRRSSAKLWVACVSLAAFGGLALTLALWQSRSASSSSPVATAIDSVKVRADVNAKWSRQTEAQTETVRLESGRLSIHVDHARSPERRLLVILPDGELEDIGTTFSVTAAAAHTTEVTVHEGRVILRLHDKPALALSAGDSWTPVATPIASAALPNPPSAAIPRSAKPAPSTPPTLAASAAASASTSAFAPTPDPATDFRDAMSALNSGDNTRAASLFAVFLAHHPRDSHAEDAAYLRVLALQRAGNTSDMKQAASAYLAQYPHGFRHAEVEPLSL